MIEKNSGQKHKLLIKEKEKQRLSLIRERTKESKRQWECHRQTEKNRDWIKKKNEK